MKQLVPFLIFLVSFSAGAANYYMVGQGGYLKLSQDAAVENNVSPAGLSYGGGLGFRKDFFEFEAILLKGSGEDDIIHDNQDNSLVHDQTSLLLALNFYLNKSFYIRAGFGVHKIDQQLGDEVNAASAEGAKEEYGIVENEVSEGVLFGGGFVLYNGKSMDLFTQVERYSYSSIKSGAWNASLGFRYYLQ